jgi:hypothetical protein
MHMETGAVIALVGLIITTLGVLLGVTWKGSQLVGSLLVLRDDFNKAVEQLEKIQVIENKQALLENMYATMKALYDEQSDKLAVLDQRFHEQATHIQLLKQAHRTLAEQIGSIKAMRRVSPSKPDIG